MHNNQEREEFVVQIVECDWEYVAKVRAAM